MGEGHLITYPHGTNQVLLLACILLGRRSGWGTQGPNPVCLPLESHGTCLFLKTLIANSIGILI